MENYCKFPSFTEIITNNIVHQLKTSGSQAGKDKSVLSRLRNGDEKALQEIYTSQADMLLRTSFKLLGDLESSRDAVQETFLKFWENRYSINIHSNLQGYLTAILRYHIFRVLKDKKPSYFNSVSLESLLQSDQWKDAVSPEQLLFEKELLSKISSSVEQLPKNCRKVFIKSRYEQLKNKEIAAEMGIATKTVENQLTKALRILKLSIGISLLVFFKTIFIFF